LRVVTINTWNGISLRGLGPRPIEPVENKARRERVLLTQLDELGADVVLLQECIPDPHFSRRLAAELGMAHVNKVNNGGVRLFGVGLPRGLGAGEGLAILSTESLAAAPVGARKLFGIGATSNVASLQLSGMYHAMAVRMELGGRPVTVFNTHLPFTFHSIADLEEAWVKETEQPLGELPASFRARVSKKIARRDRTLRRLRDWVAQAAGEGPVIVGGDFNLHFDHPDLLELVAALDLVNVLAERDPGARTWDPVRNRNVDRSTTRTWFGGEAKGLYRRLLARFDDQQQCLDHILVSRLIVDAVGEAGTAFVDPIDGVQASDHFGVWLDLTL
jgi:endonuclease/exonuclease/phosphatase family metal-dependent hydrolase